MTRHHGGALAAIVAVIVAVSTAIFIGTGAAEDRPRTTAQAASGTGPHNAAPASTGVWVGSWAAAPMGGEPFTGATGTAGRTVRNVVHTSVGGTSARITLSNLYGTRPLAVTAATLAVSADTGSAAVLGTPSRLTFGGRAEVVVPPGRETVSDAVALAVPPDANVVVSTYTPTSAGPVTYHRHARRTSYDALGDHTADTTGAPYTGRSTTWRYLTALDVLSNEAHGTVVAFGDSLTDGITSTADADRRWPDVLADRIRASADAGGDAPRYGVVNAGISGNQVLDLGPTVPSNSPSGLSRFRRDVLNRPDVKVVVIDLGVNDILRNPRLADPDAVLAGLRTLVRDAHAHGVKTVGATLMPFGGHRGYTDAREEVRQRINAGIRAGSVFDTVVDLDRALRDPYDPRRLRADHDSGDHLHPNDRGYRAMAELITWAQLKGSVPARL